MQALAAGGRASRSSAAAASVPLPILLVQLLLPIGLLRTSTNKEPCRPRPEGGWRRFVHTDPQGSPIEIFSRPGTRGPSPRPPADGDLLGGIGSDRLCGAERELASVSAL